MPYVDRASRLQAPIRRKCSGTRLRRAFSASMFNCDRGTVIPLSLDQKNRNSISASELPAVVDVMDPSSAPQTDPVPSSACIAPLTQAKHDGTPYRRRADVEAQISEVLATDRLTWPGRELKSETLVHLVRWLWRQNDATVIGPLIERLGKRIARIAQDFTSGLNKGEAEEFAIEIAEEANLLIFSQSRTRQCEFLEIAFRQAIKRRDQQGRAIQATTFARTWRVGDASPRSGRGEPRNHRVTSGRRRRP